MLSLGHLPSTDDCASQHDSPRLTALQCLQSVDVAGMLDVKWCDGVYGEEQSGLPLFAAADANGDLSLWSVNRQETTGAANCHLLEIQTVEDSGSLALSLDWSTAVCRRSYIVVLYSKCEKWSYFFTARYSDIVSSAKVAFSGMVSVRHLENNNSSSSLLKCTTFIKIG